MPPGRGGASLMEVFAAEQPLSGCRASPGLSQGAFACELELALCTKQEVLQGPAERGIPDAPRPPVSHGSGHRPWLAWPSLALWRQVACASASLGPVSSLTVSPMMSMRPYPPSCP